MTASLCTKATKTHSFSFQNTNDCIYYIRNYVDIQILDTNGVYAIYQTLREDKLTGLKSSVLNTIKER